MLGKIEISLDQIKSNWTALNFASNGKAAAVVKADAYGFGMTRITKTLINAGCKYFYVANLDEAIQLRKEITNQDIRIAVFEGFLEGTELTYFNNKLTPIINNLKQLKRLIFLFRQGKKIRAILNINTGMNRLGLHSREIDFLQKNKNIVNELEWDFIMSHLANSEDFRNVINDTQLNKLLEFSKNFPNIKLSFSNSCGIALGSKFCLDQTRPGIGIYGVNGSGENIILNSKNLTLPVKLHAPIIQIKEVGIGEAISYGGIDITARKSLLATIGIGYADGWIRQLKKNTSINIDKEECKIMGNITMDSFVLDITKIKINSLNEGDYLCLLDNYNIKNLLKELDLISYELFTLMGPRLIREYK